MALGWAGDQPWLNVGKTYGVCLVLCGVCCILMPIITDNYNILVVVCALFGVFFASNYSYTPTILVSLVPIDRFTTAYGLTLLCQGIGNLLGPPLAGSFPVLWCRGGKHLPVFISPLLQFYQFFNLRICLFFFDLDYFIFRLKQIIRLDAH